MSRFFALDGVACTTKTTIAKRLGQTPGWVAHLDDYKELSDKFQLDAASGGMLFATYRMQVDAAHLRDTNNVHLFDRQPMSALVYKLIHEKADDETIVRAFEACARMGQTKNYASLVLVAKEGTERAVVAAMKRRNNGIDVLTEEYVRQQTKVFCMWAHAFDYPLFYVDYSRSLDDQQASVTDFIMKQVYNTRYDNSDGLVVFNYRLPRVTRLIAGFDLDDTLITSTGRGTFPSNFHDWTFKYDNVKSKLARLIERGYTIVVFTNQNGVGAGRITLQDLTRKLRSVCDAIGLPMIVYAATLRNVHRKPMTGMFERMAARCEDVCRRSSFFVGDDVNGTSDADSKFARNNLIKFYRDTHYFGGDDANVYNLL